MRPSQRPHHACSRLSNGKRSARWRNTCELACNEARLQRICIEMLCVLALAEWRTLPTLSSSSQYTYASLGRFTR